jgi:hypothetical protein
MTESKGKGEEEKRENPKVNQSNNHLGADHYQLGKTLVGYGNRCPALE